MIERNKKLFGWDIHLQETEEGFVIEIKGDKERIKAKLEAVEAYHDFREKAKKAGMMPPFFWGMSRKKDSHDEDE